MRYLSQRNGNRANLSNDTILFVGRFDKRKGGDLALRVFGELAASYPTLKLTFVGPDVGFRAADGKVSYFDEFVRAYVPESYRSRIEFCGPMPQSSVETLRVKRFLTIVCSQYENGSYAVLEAMSLGCPMVATSVGGIPEAINDQKNGLLVRSQDIQGMVSACKRLLENPDFAARLGHQAWEDCRDLYNPKAIARQTAATYDEAIHAFASRTYRGS